jgi:hypothetical protein
MIAIALAVALALGGVDDLGLVSVNGLNLKVPKRWTADETEAGVNYEAPDGEGQMELSVFPVEPKRSARECMDQLLEKLGRDGWEMVRADGRPAARKVVIDYVGGTDAGRTNANRVSSVTHVGCNGELKWVLTVSSKANRAARFGVLVRRVLESLSYGKVRE